MSFAKKNKGLDKSKRRRSLNFSSRWIGRNASENSLRRYCIEIWSDIIRTIDNHKCFMCGSEEFLNAHHLISKKWLKTAFNIQCGIALCNKCHCNGITAVHVSPWIIEKKLKETRPEQYEWYSINRMEVSEAIQEKINYKDILQKLLQQFEELSPSIQQRSKRFIFLEAEEQQIVNEFFQANTSLETIAKKWECSYTCIRNILERNNISIKNDCRKKFNKKIYQKALGSCVIKIDDNNNICGEYDSMNEAARQHGLSRNSIRNCIKGLSKHSAGFKWIYKKDLKKQTVNPNKK